MRDLTLSTGDFAMQNDLTIKDVVTDHGVYPTVVEELLRELYVANVGGAVWAATGWYNRGLTLSY